MDDAWKGGKVATSGLEIMLCIAPRGGGEGNRSHVNDSGWSARGLPLPSPLMQDDTAVSAGCEMNGIYWKARTRDECARDIRLSNAVIVIILRSSARDINTVTQDVRFVHARYSI